MAVHVELRTPISVHGAELRSVTIREPKVRDIEYMEKTAGKGDYERSVVLVATLCGLDLDAVREMSAIDFRRVSDTIGKMLEGNG